MFSVLTILDTPKQWWTDKKTRIGLLLFYGVGLLSIFVLLFLFHKIDNDIIRKITLIIETIYFSFTLNSLVLAILRHLFFYIFRHYNNQRIIDVISNKTIFFVVVSIITILYLIPGFYNASNITKTTYNIEINKKCDDKEIKIALMSDIHVGGGANQKILSDMVNMLNEIKPDFVLIAGDSVDSSSST